MSRQDGYEDVQYDVVLATSGGNQVVTDFPTAPSARRPSLAKWIGHCDGPDDHSGRRSSKAHLVVAMAEDWKVQQDEMNVLRSCGGCDHLG